MRQATKHSTSLPCTSESTVTTRARAGCGKWNESVQKWSWFYSGRVGARAPEGRPRRVRRRRPRPPGAGRSFPSDGRQRRVRKRPFGALGFWKKKLSVVFHVTVWFYRVEGIDDFTSDPHEMKRLLRCDFTARWTLNKYLKTGCKPPVNRKEGCLALDYIP